MAIWLCSDGHAAICHEGGQGDCPVCDVLGMLADAEKEVEDLKDQISDLKEGAQ